MFVYIGSFYYLQQSLEGNSKNVTKEIIIYTGNICLHRKFLLPAAKPRG